MGLFGDKLILQLQAEQSSEKFTIKINKIENSINYLLSFSCISLMNSQFIVLSELNREFLCTSVLDFIRNPERKNSTPKFVSEFVFELFKKNKDRVYNQFYPRIPVVDTTEANYYLERDIVKLILKYISLIYKKSNQSDKQKIRVYLLASIVFFIQELLPIIKEVDMTDLRNREKLAIDQVSFSSSVYTRWESQLPFMPNSELFNEHLKVASNFFKN